MAIKSEGNKDKNLSQNTKNNFWMANEPRKEIIMNATMNNLTATATTSKKFAFTYDHVNKKIVGTDIAFQKAGIPGSKEEKELDARMEARPTYGFTVLPTEKKPAKQTYAGLTMEVMEAYLAIYEGELAEEMRVQFAKMKAQKEQKKMTYPTIKSWFLDLFPHFNVNKAKTAIKSSNLEKKKAPYKVIKVSVNTALLAEQRKAGNQ